MNKTLDLREPTACVMCGQVYERSEMKVHPLQTLKDPTNTGLWCQDCIDEMDRRCDAVDAAIRDDLDLEDWFE